MAITGSVSIFVDGQRQGVVNLDGSQNAQLTLNTVGVGTHSVFAVYNGDANNNSAQSATVNFTVNQAQVTKNTPTVTITVTPDPSNVGDTLTFSVHVQ